MPTREPGTARVASRARTDRYVRHPGGAGCQRKMLTLTSGHLAKITRSLTSSVMLAAGYAASCSATDHRSTAVLTGEVIGAHELERLGNLHGNGNGSQISTVCFHLDRLQSSTQCGHHRAKQAGKRRSPGRPGAMMAACAGCRWFLPFCSCGEDRRRHSTAESMRSPAAVVAPVTARNGTPVTAAGHGENMPAARAFGSCRPCRHGGENRQRVMPIIRRCVENIVNGTVSDRDGNHRLASIPLKMHKQATTMVRIIC